MRFLFLSALLCLLPVTRGQAQAAAPVEVTNSAVAAVKALGEQVVLGKHEVAIDRMYPEWKERAAKRAGGMEKLQQQLAKIPAQMAQQGVQLISFQPQGVPTSYEVLPGKEVVEENGKKVEKLIHKKWIVLIPTVTEYRIAQPAQKGVTPKFVVIRSTGFQVAVSDKEKNDWTFIDGVGLTVADLQRLFITLPQNMELPPIARKQVQGK
ncbi:hypothetical protein OKA04_07055 [Luteolibacter flavescens]|uniref:Uncharacterized protein n=1 Tax=Luteolibacter flavescens TaxID=1859460 RepID=A0ABT3FLN4_9BACT|nr:hypothetical protein [Luteolibacter flavescens]MCW1884484.1 hypothetical protein [Luteolibacter flavescens]